MKEEELNDWISELKTQRLRSCPSNTEANVLRRVRLAKAGAEIGFWSWINAVIPSTKFAMAAMALVLATSSMVTFASASAYAAGVQRRTEASRALDLGFVKSTELIDFSKNH